MPRVIRVYKRDPVEWSTHGTVSRYQRPPRYRRPSEYTPLIPLPEEKFETPMFRDRRVRKPKQVWLFHPWISDIYFPRRPVRLEYDMFE